MIDARQVDLEYWNDHKHIWLDNAEANSYIFNPLNETTYQVVRKGDDYNAKVFYFDAKIEDGGVEPLCDGREHKISYLNDQPTSVEVEVGLSADEIASDSVLRDTIGTVLLGSQQVLTIYFYWVEFGGIRYCIVHHVIT